MTPEMYILRKMREKVLIHTDQPTKEIWSSLRYFESQHNCTQYLKSKFTLSKGKLEEISRELAYAIRTAEEYYHASNQVSILTQPLQIYYCMIHLSKSLFLATYGKKSPSQSHGLQKVGRWNEKVLVDMCVKVLKDGTFPQLHSCYRKDKLRGTTFRIGELFSLVPELKASFESVYKQKSNALRMIRPLKNVVHIIDPDLKKYGFILETKTTKDYEEGQKHNSEILSRIPGISEKYDISDTIKPFWAPNALFLREKWRSENIEDSSILAVSAEEYFLMGLQKGEKLVTLPELSSHFLIMYVLGMLSRYEPMKWGEIVKGEKSGDIYVIQKFLETIERKFPNLILNELEDKQFMFVAPGFEPSKRVELDREHLEKIYEYVKEELAREIRRFR